jgi:hypothetical protein
MKAKNITEPIADTEAVGTTAFPRIAITAPTNQHRVAATAKINRLSQLITTPSSVF